MDLTAVVVARKGSKRIPNKLHEKIGRNTLVERKVHQLLKSNYVNNIIVGSDDESLKPLVESLGVKFVLRPEEFCDEVSRTPNDMVKNMLSYFESSHVLWAHPTNPFIDETIYDMAIEAFINDNKYDSLFSATEIHGYFNTKNGPVNYSYSDNPHKIASELLPLYLANGGIFIRDYLTMKEDGAFFGEKPKLFAVDIKTGWDIDYPWQLETARKVFYEG